MTVITPTGFLPQKTIAYKTYLKTALVNAIKVVYDNHPDEQIRTKYDSSGNRIGGTFVTIEFPTDERDYPTLLVRYIERSVENAGVGHLEYIENPTTKGVDVYKHTFYRGVAQFDIFALSSLDRDLVSDSLVQILRLPEMETYTNQFFNEIFNTEIANPNLNYININTDNITGTGDSTAPQPWLSENQLVYQTGYRADIFGEFYSLPQNNAPIGYIEHVNVYPYISELGQTVPSGYVSPGLYPYPNPNAKTFEPTNYPAGYEP